MNIYDIRRNVLLSTDIYDLAKFGVVDKLSQRICNDRNFWIDRLNIHKFPRGIKCTLGENIKQYKYEKLCKVQADACLVKLLRYSDMLLYIYIYNLEDLDILRIKSINMASLHYDYFQCFNDLEQGNSLIVGRDGYYIRFSMSRSEQNTFELTTISSLKFSFGVNTMSEILFNMINKKLVYKLSRTLTYDHCAE